MADDLAARAKFIKNETGISLRAWINKNTVRINILLQIIAPCAEKNFY